MNLAPSRAGSEEESAERGETIKNFKTIPYSSVPYHTTPLATNSALEITNCPPCVPTPWARQNEPLWTHKLFRFGAHCVVELKISDFGGVGLYSFFKGTGGTGTLVLAFYGAQNTAHAWDRPGWRGVEKFATPVRVERAA